MADSAPATDILAVIYLSARYKSYSFEGRWAFTYVTSFWFSALFAYIIYILLLRGDQLFTIATNFSLSYNNLFARECNIWSCLKKWATSHNFTPNRQEDAAAVRTNVGAVDGNKSWPIQLGCLEQPPERAGCDIPPTGAYRGFFANPDGVGEYFLPCCFFTWWPMPAFRWSDLRIT